MTYIIKQKIGDGFYAYEVQSYWDPKKKQSRQKRRYLGVWDDATGKITPKESQREINTTKSLGPPYLLNAIADEIKLRKKLTDAFGQDGDAILAIAMSIALNQASLNNLHHILGDSFLPEMYSLKESFSLQWLSNFLERLSSKDAAMISFYNSLISVDEALIFGITSFSSTSRNANWLEYGYNRDGLDLPQVNLGLVLSLHQHIPLCLKLFSGSINDAGTLKNLVDEIKAFCIIKSIFILDRGFYSENNIMEMNSQKIDFIIPLPLDIKIAEGLISDTIKDIEKPINAKRFGGDIFYILEHDVEIGGINVYGYLLSNKEREKYEKNSFFNRLNDIENMLNGKDVKENPFEHFERTAGTFARYFECTVNDKTICLRRRANAISQAVNRFGKTILISSTKRSWNEMLSLYRERDEIEKKFDDLKNELDAVPFKVQKVATLQGLLFIFFISLVLRAMLRQKARSAGPHENSSIDGILLELAKVRAVKIGGKWRMTEISKKQRDILEKMKISVPVEANIVIKRGGV